MNYYQKIYDLLVESTLGSGKVKRALRTRRGSINGKPLTFKNKKGYTPPSRNVDATYRAGLSSKVQRHIRQVKDVL